MESVKRGVSRGETARRFGVNSSTLKRYLEQLDEGGSLLPKKAPGKPSRSQTPHQVRPGRISDPPRPMQACSARDPLTL